MDSPYFTSDCSADFAHWRRERAATTLFCPRRECQQVPSEWPGRKQQPSSDTLSWHNLRAEYAIKKPNPLSQQMPVISLSLSSRAFFSSSASNDRSRLSDPNSLMIILRLRSLR